MKKIIILGAGQVGYSLAAQLALEDNDITVIDLNPKRLKLLADRFDLRTVVGNAAHPSVLQEAGIEDCELLIAVTEVDEINMLACRIAHMLFNVPDRVARIRAVEYFRNEHLSDGTLFDINHMICPEQVVTDYLLKLIEFPEALQVLEFANDRVPNTDARIVAIFRENGSLRPDGEAIIRTGDEVFVLSERDDMRKVMLELRKMDRPVKRVMIAGGSDIAQRLAMTLEKRDMNVKLIEPDRERAKTLAGLLSKTLVLNASESDGDLLDDEGVAEVDMFVAATDSDERNIIAGLLAKRKGASRVVALIHKTEYVDLLEASNIDIVIGLAEASIGEILAHVRRADVDAAHSLRRGASEVLEIIAHGDGSTSKVVGRRVDEIHWPVGALLGAVVRDDQVFMAHHDLVIKENDHMVIFVSDKKIIPRIEQLMQVTGLFL